MTLQQKEKWFGIAIALPGLLMVFATIFYPLGVGIVHSFKKAHLLKLKKAKWNGFDNYEKLFSDDLFWNALSNTIIMTTLWTFGAALLGLMLAVALNRERLIDRIIGGMLLIPWIMPPIAVAFMFQYMYAGRNGIILELLQIFGVERKSGFSLFMDLTWAQPTIILTTIWMAFPFFLVMFLAGLKTIPKDILEAATIDGASRIAKFRFITLPLLKNIIVIATTLSIIWGFNFFDLIFATTRGGPVNKTDTLVIFAQRVAFEELNLGYSSALGVVWLIGLTIFSYIYLRAMKVI